MSVLTLYMKKSLCCCLLCNRVVHPHYLYMCSNYTDLIYPVTWWAAPFWIFCNVCESCSEHPSHTTDAYSTTIGSR